MTNEDLDKLKLIQEEIERINYRLDLLEKNYKEAHLEKIRFYGDTSKDLSKIRDQIENIMDGDVDENDEDCLSLKSLSNRMDENRDWIISVSKTVNKIKPEFQEEIDSILVKLENLDARVKETNGYYRDLTCFEERLQKLERNHDVNK